MTRRVSGLLWARRCPRPAALPPDRSSKSARGAMRVGLRYERALARHLQGKGRSALPLKHGQWFEFEDSFGFGYCQPDLILSFLPRFLAVLEVKHTLTSEAFEQLYFLYGPIVGAVWNVPVALVAVFKNFPSSGGILVHETLEMACQYSLDTGRVGLIQWVGQPLHVKPAARLKTVLQQAAAQQDPAARLKTV